MCYRICPDCGAYLDPGEKCDCQSENQNEEPPSELEPLKAAHKKNLTYQSYNTRKEMSNA